MNNDREIKIDKFENMLSDVPHCYMDTVVMQHQKEFIHKQDETIKAAFIKNGIDFNDTDHLKNNLTRIIIKGDEFDHYYMYYGTDKEIRIISIQRIPEIINNYSDNKYTITFTCKYY